MNAIEKPGRYLGGEINASRKSFDAARVRLALAFPDVYEVGLSHLGLRVLYHLLNGMEGVMADRVYAPWQDYEQRLRSEGEPLRGLESERPLADFDFLGFSLQYELSYTNILTILDLAGIPFEAADRTSEHPWVIAGGPCAFNPEPLADMLDFVVLGEAEELLPELIAVFLEWRRAEGTRLDFLERIRHIEGIYVPSFFKVAYHADGRIAAVEPQYSDYTQVAKRLVTHLDEGSPLPEEPLVPLVDIVHNRLGMEIARGCTRGCRFCQAGFIYRPVRERDPKKVLEGAERALASSGFEELSLLSLSTGDYCQVQALLAALMDRFSDEKVAVSLPSMRVGTLSPELMDLIRQVRKTGFTLAPEAGSERLRRVINKGILDEDLEVAVTSAFQLGWRLLKLYFMIGLPTENEADLEAMTALCLKVWKLAKPSRSSINVSVSTFVPKPMTPFQWLPQLPQPEVEQRLVELKERLKRPGLRVKWHHPALSFLEAVFARGDRRLGRVLVQAWREGARFDGWTELFREELWRRAFQETDIDPEFYAYRERARDEILPWDHLSSGVEKKFLWNEYERAVAEEFTPDCRWDRCSGCGVCDHRTVQPELYKDHEGLQVAEVPSAEAEASQNEFLYRLHYAKTGKMRFYGHLEVAQIFSRAIRRAGLPATYTRGFHPHVKLSFAEALPLGMESLVEEAHLTLSRKVDAERLRLDLNRHLPEGLHIEEAAPVGKRLTRAAELRVTYRISGLSPFEVRAIIDRWSERPETVVVKKSKRGEVRARLTEVLLDIRRLDDASIEMDLYEGTQKCFRPVAILHHLLGEPVEHWSKCRICKVALSRIVGPEESEDVGRAHHQR